ncbi:MAG: RNA 2',3'-cyclic phosphodiesterase [Peptococcaceae bacterium]|nr:RNA 2',3'-cyclic phosphodiesterase [Peptococcaceae bacterium]
MRLFIAINFNDNTRSRLFDLRNKLRSRSESGNFSLPENLHLTLAFIGEISPKKVDIIETILETVTFSSFEATINRLGTFSRGTLWYAGLHGHKPLILLQREIEYKLALCGFEMDGRKYKPHVTLGRKVLTEAVPWEIEPFGETVTAIDLMKSEQIGGKLIYTTLHTNDKYELLCDEDYAKYSEILYKLNNINPINSEE